MKIFLLIAVVVFVCSCDPMRRINIKNQSKEEAVVIWQLHEDSVLTSPFYTGNEPHVKYQLKQNPPYNIIKIPFGYGRWTTDYIKSIADDVKSLVIIKGSDSSHFNSTAQIWQYLEERKKGFGKKRIEIIIK
jgi:hypothetical protein